MDSLRASWLSFDLKRLVLGGARSSDNRRFYNRHHPRELVRETFSSASCSIAHLQRREIIPHLDHLDPTSSMPVDRSAVRLYVSCGKKTIVDGAMIKS
jgi:hypothetical protein